VHDAVRCNTVTTNAEIPADAELHVSYECPCSQLTEVTKTIVSALMTAWTGNTTKHIILLISHITTIKLYTKTLNNVTVNAKRQVTYTKFTKEIGKM
jgi:hypothetical protein